MIEDQAVSVPAFEIDLNGWRLRNYWRYRDAMRVEDFEAAWDELVLIIKAWPYGAVDFEVFGGLAFGQVKELNRALGAAMNEAFAQGN